MSRHDDEHHDNRYEDGDIDTGTMSDYDDWVGPDGDSQWLPIPPRPPVLPPSHWIEPHHTPEPGWNVETGRYHS